MSLKFKNSIEQCRKQAKKKDDVSGNTITKARLQAVSGRLTAKYDDQLFNMGKETFKKIITILAIFGCYNKMLRTVELNNKCLFSTNLANEYKIKGLADFSVQWEVCFLFVDSSLLSVIHMIERVRGADVSSSFHKGISSIMGQYSLNQLPPQGPTSKYNYI